MTDQTPAPPKESVITGWEQQASFLDEGEGHEWVALLDCGHRKPTGMRDGPPPAKEGDRTFCDICTKEAEDDADAF